MSKLGLIAVLLISLSAAAFAQAGSDAQPHAQGDASQTVQVSAAEMTGMVDHKVMPTYPPEAMAKGVHGDVVFKIVVDETGKIVHSENVSGDPTLVAASQKAMQEFHFRPYLIDGQPVKVESKLGFQFAVSHEGDATEGHVECMTAIP